MSGTPVLTCQPGPTYCSGAVQGESLLPGLASGLGWLGRWGVARPPALSRTCRPAPPHSVVGSRCLASPQVSTARDKERKTPISEGLAPMVSHCVATDSDSKGGDIDTTHLWELCPSLWVPLVLPQPPEPCPWPFSSQSGPALFLPCLCVCCSST